MGPAPDTRAAPAAGAQPGARSVAALLLEAVLARGRPLDEALAGAVPFPRLAPRDRAFCRLLTATVLRRLGQIDWLVGDCLARPLPAGAGRTRNALRLGAAQLLFLEVPPHAAVNETVELLAGPRRSRARGLVNAILKRLAREGGAARDRQDAARLNTPDWLWRRWSDAYGAATARRIAEAHLADPPLDITVKADPALWAERLEATPLPTGTLRRRPGHIVALPGFDDGGWWVQDAAAALAARTLLAGLPGGGVGSRAADLCAAPGGKTAQLAAAGAQVTALDISTARLARLDENLRRLALRAETIAADLRDWTPPAPFDAVLLDAPCSGTGTLRRRPDIAHIKGPGEPRRAAALQSDLLDGAARCVRPGGLLVYSVCSLEPEEGAGAVADFLARDGRFARQPVAPDEIPGVGAFVTPAGDIRTLPCDLAGKGGMDGFHICRLRRRG